MEAARADCERYQDDLVLLAYERPEFDRALLEGHLAACERCRQELTQLRLIRAALGAGELPVLHEDAFVDKVITTVRMRPVVEKRRTSKRLDEVRRPARRRNGRRNGRRRSTVVWTAATAVAVLVVVLGWRVWTGGAGPAAGGAGGPSGLEEPGIAEKAPQPGAPVSLAGLVGKVRAAASAEDLRSLEPQVTRALDLEAAKPALDAGRWANLSLAEILTRAADRMAYREAVACALELADSAGAPAETRPPVGAALPVALAAESAAGDLERIRRALAEGKSGEAAGLVPSLKLDSAEAVALAGRALTHEVRGKIAAGLPASEWGRLQVVSLPRTAAPAGAPAKEAALLEGLAMVAAGDLAAARLDFARALAEWDAAEKRLTPDHAELAASLRFRRGCVMHLVCRRARDGARAFEDLTERYPGSAPAHKFRKALAVWMRREAETEAAATRAFLDAMGIRIDPHQQVLHLPCASGQSASFDPAKALLSVRAKAPGTVTAVQFPRAFALPGPGRGTVVSGQIRLTAAQAGQPVGLNLLAGDGQRPPTAGKLSALVSGLTYHFWLVLWEGGEAKAPFGVHLTYGAEGLPAKPIKNVSSVPLGGGSGPARGGARCRVLSIPENVAVVEFMNLQLRTDVDLSASIPLQGGGAR